jgi:hypothetical protein
LGLEGFKFGDRVDEGPFAAGAVDPPGAPPTEPPAEFPPAPPPAPAACAHDAADIPSAMPNPNTITSCFFILTCWSRMFACGENSPRFIAFRRLKAWVRGVEYIPQPGNGAGMEPAPLAEKDFAPWLSGEAGIELLKPAADDLLQRWPVSKRVNSSKAPADDPALIDKIIL